MDMREASSRGIKEKFRQAYREARANGRIGYCRLGSPAVRMAAAQVLRDRLTQDELAHYRRRRAELEAELLWRSF